jgi:type I restriction enzyme S subunit
MKSKLLKELCFEDKCGIYGIPATAEEYNEDKTRYLRITDISEDGKLLNDTKKSVSADDIEKYILEEGDIVFARTGNSTGKSYYHEPKNGRLAFAGFLIKYSLDSTLVNPKYVRYYTITKQYKQWVENFSLGSTRGNINAQSFGDCPIPFPDRPIQDFLVKVLSDLDSKIEINNRINAGLEAMAKTLYDYWFVQFDFPDANGKPYKTSGGKMVWNAELNRYIPDGWEVKKLEEIENNIITGKTPSTKVEENFGGDIPFVTIDDIRKQLFLFYADRTLTKKGADSQSNKYLQPGDICVSCIGTIGVIGIIGTSCQTNQQINSISKIKDFNRFFLLNALKDYFNFNVAAKKGAVLDNMNKGDFSIIPILDAPNKLKIEYNRIANSFYTKIENNLKENQELASLRDWLLPMLMNGQVSVGEVEEELGMVAEERAEYRKRE